MAAADYRLCDVCHSKTYYDAEVSYEDAPPGHRLHGSPIPDGVGDWAVICKKCAETWEVVVRPLSKEPAKCD